MKTKALLATPKIKDPYFHKSMILIIRKEKNYQYGLILNKTMDEKVREIWDVVNPNANIYKNKNLRNGGPIYGSISVIHKIKKYSEEEIFNKTYMSIHPENIERILENKTKPYEMYVGYCSWSDEQLAAEMIMGSWWETEPDDFMIFDDNSDYWKLKKEEQNKKILDKLKLKMQNHICN